jgi:hypothetical protein
MARTFRLKPIKPTEAQIQDAILRYLAVDSRVLWAQRMNSGKGKLLRPDGSQTWIRFGFPGCPDIMGQLKDGRYLAIECKRSGGRVRPEQREHITQAAAYQAVALIARSLEDVQTALDAAVAVPGPGTQVTPHEALVEASRPAVDEISQEDDDG